MSNKQKPIKWRNNPLDYNYPRTSRDAFGYGIKDGELELPKSKGTSDWVYVLVLMVVLLFWVILGD